MNVVLSRETHKLLEDRIRQGGYGSADEAVRAALEATESPREVEDEETATAVTRGLDEADRGETLPLAELRAELQRKGLCK
jgi:Arc/MetJ-type ribon-helix-helix transcriptional regulator